MLIQEFNDSCQNLVHFGTLYQGIVLRESTNWDWYFSRDQFIIFVKLQDLKHPNFVWDTFFAVMMAIVILIVQLWCVLAISGMFSLITTTDCFSSISFLCA